MMFTNNAKVDYAFCVFHTFLCILFCSLTYLFSITCWQVNKTDIELPHMVYDKVCFNLIKITVTKSV